MQFKSFIVAAALMITSGTVANAATITGFAGADCTGTQGQSFTVSSRECFTLGAGSTKSIRYSGVPSSIQFYLSGGGHDACTNGSSLTRGSGSGCATAPAGFNWESVAVF